MIIPQEKHQQDAYLRNHGITDYRVREAFFSVPRQRFLPEQLQKRAYDDTALPIGNKQTISQPSLVAFMTQALELTGKESVLEIGTGSGYQTALLSHLAKNVISIERIPELARQAKKLLRQLGYTNVTVIHGDGTKGYQRYAPYDAIIVTAGAPTIPPALIDQLDEGGRLVIPVGSSANHQVLQKGRKKGEKIQMKTLEAVRFVPLIGAHGWKISDTYAQPE